GVGEEEDGGAVPLHLEEVVVRVERSTRLSQHRGDEGGQRRRRLGGASGPGCWVVHEDFLRRTWFRRLGATFWAGLPLVWGGTAAGAPSRATLCFKASSRLITCGMAGAGEATIWRPATLASIRRRSWSGEGAGERA